MKSDIEAIYETMSESLHQQELFSWAAVVGLVGLETATAWAHTHPLTPKRPKLKDFLARVYESASKTLSESEGGVLPPRSHEGLTASVVEAIRNRTDGDDRLRWLHSIPNGGSRGSTKADRQRTGARMRAEGVKRGVPDVFLPVGGYSARGLYLELKRARKGRLSSEQKQFRGHCISMGYHHEVCEGYLEAINKITSYLHEEC